MVDRHGPGQRRLDHAGADQPGQASLERHHAGVAAGLHVGAEHLQLVGAQIEAASERFVTAGAIFVGARTPEVFGDYVAGPSHVLPTCGTARFASGLSIETFRRRTHRIEVRDAAAAARFATASAALAAAEGLPAHAAAATARLGGGAR